MIIKVTKEHIIHGTAGSCSSCPIALAIDAKKYKLRIRPEYIVSLGRKICELPIEVQSFIKKFDFGFFTSFRRNLDPIEFHLSAEVFMQ